MRKLNSPANIPRQRLSPDAFSSHSTVGVAHSQLSAAIFLSLLTSLLLSSSSCMCSSSNYNNNNYPCLPKTIQSLQPTLTFVSLSRRMSLLTSTGFFKFWSKEMEGMKTCMNTLYFARTYCVDHPCGSAIL